MRWFISLSAYHTPAYHMKPTNLPCEKPFPSSTMHSFKPVPTPHRVLGGVRCTTIPRSRQLLERKLASAAHSNAESNGKGLDCPPSPAVDSSNMPSNPYNWTFDSKTPAKLDPKVQDIPVDLIRRPLGRTRKNDQAKVDALMKSIMEIGLQEPIDVLLVDGQYYGFSGCHRYEAHQRLGLKTIKCRVRKANQQVLKMHMM